MKNTIASLVFLESMSYLIITSNLSLLLDELLSTNSIPNNVDPLLNYQIHETHRHYIFRNAFHEDIFVKRKYLITPYILSHNGVFIIQLLLVLFIYLAHSLSIYVILFDQGGYQLPKLMSLFSRHSTAISYLGHS